VPEVDQEHNLKEEIKEKDVSACEKCFKTCVAGLIVFLIDKLHLD
jgi:hypothetical protein